MCNEAQKQWIFNYLHIQDTAGSQTERMWLIQDSSQSGGGGLPPYFVTNLLPMPQTKHKNMKNMDT